MFAMIIVGTFAAYLFYLQGITDAGPVRAGLVGCVEPVSATVISAVWLGTPVGVVDVVGCAMIIGMVFLVTEREEGSAARPRTTGRHTTFRRSKGAPPSWATTRRAVPRATTSNARRRCWRTVIAPWPRSA